MAEYLNICRRAAALLAAAASILAVPATAQALADPTRPPDAFAVAATGPEAAPAGPVLQSILVSQQRAEAIIGGRTVKVGDKVGDARVVKISETEVILRSGTSAQTLRLFPLLEKRRAERAEVGRQPRRQEQPQ